MYQIQEGQSGEWFYIRGSESHERNKGDVRTREEAQALCDLWNNETVFKISEVTEVFDMQLYYWLVKKNRLTCRCMSHEDAKEIAKLLNRK